MRHPISKRLYFDCAIRYLLKEMHQPAYLTLHEKKELGRRIKALGEILTRCRLCPRACEVNRLAGEQGYCRAGGELMISSAFSHFGEVLFDLIKFSSLSEQKKQNLLTIEGEENVKTALTKEKGVLIVTAHYGNWELGIIILSKLGKIDVIARALDIKRLEDELLAIRESFGGRVIYKQQAMRQTLRSLKENRIVAILIDQNVLHDQAIFVDFFGKLAATTPALATFHLRTGAPIIPAFSLPRASRGYHIRLLEPLEFTLSGDVSADVQHITQECTKIIEDQIRAKPEFWLWFHDRWRTQPKI